MNQALFSSPRGAKGFSLLELLLVLGVTASMMVAAFVVYPQAKRSHVINQTVDQLYTVREALPNGADPIALASNINQSVPIRGLSWQLVSIGQDGWNTFITVSGRQQEICAKLGFSLLAIGEPAKVNGVELTKENALGACDSPVATFSFPPVPRSDTTMVASAGSPSPVQKESIETNSGVDVDIYANDGPAQREKWNEAGGF